MKKTSIFEPNVPMLISSVFENKVLYLLAKREASPLYDKQGRHIRP